MGEAAGDNGCDGLGTRTSTPISLQEDEINQSRPAHILKDSLRSASRGKVMLPSEQ